MGACGKIVFFSILAVSIYLGYKINYLSREVAAPVFENTWWGPGKESNVDTSIRPFTINISDTVITDLKYRLENARPYIPSLENSKQHFGMNIKLLNEIVAFWKTKYVWKDRQAYLNQYPQFKTQIQGLDIHYLHVKPKKIKGVRVLPMLMMHGWPGSVKEFYEAIPLMTTPQPGKDFVFELIIPSLPGYGFSQAAAKPGLGPHAIAVVFKNLMQRLGFDKYYVQGGDWGGVIATNMGALFKDHILGVHSNLCLVNLPITYIKLLLGSLYPSAAVGKTHESKVYPLSTLGYTVLLEFGYMHLQATKPDTVGVALNDSPVGLAAYIIEKFSSWTDLKWKDKIDAGLTIKYKYEDLLDNIMIYWVTNTITSSMRLYSEYLNMREYGLNIDNVRVKVPSVCSRSPNEVFVLTDFFLTDRYENLVYSSDIEDGGHFVAMEVPKIFVEDVYTGIEKMEQVQ